MAGAGYTDLGVDILDLGCRYTGLNVGVGLGVWARGRGWFLGWGVCRSWRAKLGLPGRAGLVCRGSLKELDEEIRGVWMSLIW